MSRLLLTSDWHITSKSPRCRNDNYSESQFLKIRYLLDSARNEKCDVLLLAGDVFNAPEITFNWLIRYLDLFSSYDDVNIYSVYGQHDLKYRQKEDTPLRLFGKFNVIKILEGPLFFDNSIISGVSFGEDIKPVEHVEGMVNILVIHRMIIDEKIWSEQIDYLDSKDHLKWAEGYDFVLSGDNHKTFKTGGKDKIGLFNPGSLMRSRTDQYEHKPVYGILDTRNMRVQIKSIPVVPSEDVINLGKKDGVDAEVRFDKFFSLFGKDGGKINFIQILRDKLCLNPEIKDIVERIIENAK